MVRTTPLLTKASPPTLSTFSTTWAMSASVASGDMTTTMVVPSLACDPVWVGGGRSRAGEA